MLREIGGAEVNGDSMSDFWPEARK